MHRIVVEVKALLIGTFRAEHSQPVTSSCRGIMPSRRLGEPSSPPVTLIHSPGTRGAPTFNLFILIGIHLFAKTSKYCSTISSDSSRIHACRSLGGQPRGNTRHSESREPPDLRLHCLRIPFNPTCSLRFTRF